MSDLEESLRETLRPVVVDVVREELADRAREREPSAYLTVAEAADVLRAKPQRVYDLLSNGTLTRIKDGSRVLVARAELDTYLTRKRNSRRL